MFVICIGIVCRYFVGYGSCMLCEAWSLKIYDEYVWVFCEEGVCKIYGSVIDNMKVEYSKYMR